MRRFSFPVIVMVLAGGLIGCRIDEKKTGEATRRATQVSQLQHSVH